MEATPKPRHSPTRQTRLLALVACLSLLLAGGPLLAQSLHTDPDDAGARADLLLGPATDTDARLDPKRALRYQRSEPRDDNDDEPEQQKPRFGWLEIHTNYEALVTVDGQPYPRRSEHGMKLQAGARHEVTVKLGEKEKTYSVFVKPKEKRILMVDLTGYQTPPSPAPRVSPSPSPKINKKEEKKEDDETMGKLTVYSKPKGEVFVDGSALGASTPMINRELEVGRHEVQVKWEGGQMSEVKTVRIRKGSKLKLFFRDRSK